MKEEFLHYLWKYRLYDPESLRDDEGNRIEVISPGEYNRDAGPDFFNARIKTGNTEWAGNVEIHILASHFDLHGHNSDPLYDNVILHVVSANDRPVFNSKNSQILTTELRFDPSLYESYLDLINNPATIACQPFLKELDPFVISTWFSRISIERLELKSQRIEELFKQTGNDWEETIYRLISRYFGFRVNTDPFEMLVTELPSRIIRKHANSRFQIEALLFGTAGMLEQGLFPGAINDPYYLSLAKEYKILRAKYSLVPVHGWLWKFSRLRPANFPTIRISQLAAMLSVSGGLFARMVETCSLEEMRKIFEAEASEYWDDHYVFGKTSRKRNKFTGVVATDILLINAVIPVLFTYGRHRDRQDLCDRAVAFLEALNAEDNIVTRDWDSAGIKAVSAFRSQAMLQLRSEYCTRRRCIECMIGTRLLSLGKKLRKADELILEP